MNERAKSIVAIYLSAVALFAAVVHDISGDVMSGVIRLEVHVAAQQVRQDVVAAPHRAEAIGKAIAKTRALLNGAWAIDRAVDRAEIAVLAALFAGGISFNAGALGALALVGLSVTAVGASLVFLAATAPGVIHAVLSAIGGSLALLPAIITGAV